MFMFRDPPRVRKAKLPKGLSSHEEVILRLAPKMQRALLAAAKTAQGRIDLARLSADIEAGRVSGAIRTLGVDMFTSEDLATAARYIVDAHTEGRVLGSIKVDPAASGIAIALDVTNPRALRAAEQQAAELLTAVNDETKATVRDLIARAYREQITTRDTARLIRDVVGLNDRQATALFNFRAGLVEDAVKPDRIAAQVERYGDRLLRQRADMIAQAEIHRASADGQHELWREGVREGRIDVTTALRFWIPNEGACDWCEELADINSEGVPIDGQYETPDGDMIDGPGDSHVGCRCSEGLDMEGG